MSGSYVVFEGNDGAGKTTTMKAVIDELKNRHSNFNALITHQPGSTALGKHIRTLVKFPEKIDQSIEIDSLSRQLLYMVDCTSFTRTLLEPALAAGNNVFSDRNSFISSLVYGLADGLNLNDIAKLHNVITPPKVDKLYILQCPLEIAKLRLSQNGQELDRYDKESSEFFKRIENNYSNLINGPADQTILVARIVALYDIVYIDTTMPFDKIVSRIANDLSEFYVSSGLI